jgi:hypothetical protein
MAKMYQEMRDSASYMKLSAEYDGLEKELGAFVDKKQSQVNDWRHHMKVLLCTRSLLISSTFLVVLLAAVNTVAAQEKANNVDQETRNLLAQSAKEQLDPELAKFQWTGKKEGRETTVIKNPIKDIVLHTDWAVTVNARSVDPVKNSRFAIPNLVRRNDATMEVSLVVTVPVSGDIWGEIKTVGKTKVDFKAGVRLEADGVIKRKSADSDEVEITISHCSAALTDVEIKPDLAGILSGEARATANKMLDEKKGEMRDRANEALARAARERKLRL